MHWAAVILTDSAPCYERNTMNNPTSKQEEPFFSFSQPSDEEIRKALFSIPCDRLNYTDWIAIGTCLKNGGPQYFDLWNEWSSKDGERYKESEMPGKWRSFKGQGYSWGVLFGKAAKFGYHRNIEEAFRDRAAQPITSKEGIKQFETELMLLFKPGDRINIEPDPKCGGYGYTYTYEEWFSKIHSAQSIAEILPGYSPDRGCWITMNPLKGNIRKDEEIAAFRFCLVECDSMPVQNQIEGIKKLQLPYACLIFTGNRSVHAVVHIDAENIDEYRSRVQLLYEECRRAGLEVDTACSNPSRMTRLAGVQRGESYQRIIENSSSAVFHSWDDWVNRKKNAFIQVHSNALSAANFFDLIKQSGKAISTGFKRLDGLLDGGLFPGSVYTIGAASSCGKTTFCLQCADAIAAGGVNVIYFALEQSRMELIAKSVSRLTYQIAKQSHESFYICGRTSRQIMNYSQYGSYTDEQREVINTALEQYKVIAPHIFTYENDGAMTAQALLNESRMFCRIMGEPPVLILDYLQLLRPEKQNITDKQNTDAGILMLKTISRELNIPVLCISSLNRASYSDPVNMASYKESGAIEYSSDVLLGLQFSEVEKDNGQTNKAFNIDTEKSREPRKMTLKILKARNGGAGESVRFDYFARFNCFEEQEGGGF